jgi:hypothetical protein
MNDKLSTWLDAFGGEPCFRYCAFPRHEHIPTIVRGLLPQWKAWLWCHTAHRSFIVETISHLLWPVSDEPKAWLRLPLAHFMLTTYYTYNDFEVCVGTIIRTAPEHLFDTHIAMATQAAFNAWLKDHEKVPVPVSNVSNPSDTCLQAIKKVTQ